MILDKLKLEGLRNKLLAEKEGSGRRLEELKGRLDFGDDVEGKDSFEQETDEAEEFAVYLGIKEELGKRQKSIDAALAKIGAGLYGKCERDGKDIEIEVLEADPASGLCKDCKSEG